MSPMSSPVPVVALGSPTTGRPVSVTPRPAPALFSPPIGVVGLFPAPLAGTSGTPPTFPVGFVPGICPPLRLRTLIFLPYF